MTDASD